MNKHMKAPAMANMTDHIKFGISTIVVTEDTRTENEIRKSENVTLLNTKAIMESFVRLSSFACASCQFIGASS